jgi:hypothetical protein
MTELEWLEQQSGLTKDELKAMEAVAGHAKFVGMLQKIIASNETAVKEKQTAEQARIDFEKRYNDEFIPEMRKVTQDSLRAQGELAAAQVRLKAARDYGIVPDEEKKESGEKEPPRAPGSPAPTFDGNAWAAKQSKAIITLNDLNAEHFKLFGAPLSGTQELVDMVEREHTLGRKDFTLQKAWEQKNNVPEKRAEIAKAEQQKVIDAAIAADRKVQAEKSGSNPNVRSGVPSRFSSYKPSDATGNKEPWKTSHSTNERNRPWRDKAVSKVREAMAS